MRLSHSGSQAEGAVLILNIPGSAWRLAEGALGVLCLQVDALAQKLHGSLFPTPELVPQDHRGPGRAVGGCGHREQLQD